MKLKVLLCIKIISATVKYLSAACKVAQND